MENDYFSTPLSQASTVEEDSRFFECLYPFTLPAILYPWWHCALLHDKYSVLILSDLYISQWILKMRNWLGIIRGCSIGLNSKILENRA